jgi:CRP-like cAMP-binding protein
LGDHNFLKYKKGDFIYLQGDVSEKIFLISSGTVKIGFWDESGEEIVTTYLKKGNIFGENVVLNESHRKDFAQAMSNDTVLCSITMKQTEELLRDNKNFSNSIFKFIGFKFRKIERRYQIMLFRNTRTRILEFIKEMKADDHNALKLVNGEVVIHNPYSQAEIAKLIGASRPTLNLLVKELENEGFFSWKKGKILLKKPFLSEI